MRTAEYYYGIEDVDGREVFAYHWHPLVTPQVLFPHLHVYKGAIGRASLERGDLPLTHNALRTDLNEAHLPTRRVALEDVLRLLLEQFDVEARCDRTEWDKRLRETRRSFVEDRSWL